LLQDFATDDAPHRILVLRTGPFIANDRTFFNEIMDVACGIHKLAFNDAGKVVLDVPNDLNSQLHKNGIIGAPPQVGTVGVTSLLYLSSRAPRNLK
jgi:hypothetical protein